MPAAVLAPKLGLLNIGASGKGFLNRRRVKDQPQTTRITDYYQYQQNSDQPQQHHNSIPARDQPLQSLSSSSPTDVAPTGASSSSSTSHASTQKHRRSHFVAKRAAPKTAQSHQTASASASASATVSSKPALNHRAVSATRQPRKVSAASKADNTPPMAIDHATCSGSSGGLAAGMKRKRPSLAVNLAPKPRAASGSSTATTRSASRKMREPPVSTVSTSSALSRSSSDESVATQASRRTSKSSVSIRQDFRNMALGSQSPEVSPTRSRLNTSRRTNHKGSWESISPVEAKFDVRRPSSSRSRIGKRAALDDEGASSEGEQHLTRDVAEDQRLLEEAPRSELERLRKDRLARMASRVDLFIDGQTKTAIIDSIVEQRDRGFRSRYLSSRRAVSGAKPKSRGSRGRLSSPSPRSARSFDFTDDSEGEYAAHEGGAEETEAESKHHRGAHYRKLAGSKLRGHKKSLPTTIASPAQAIETGRRNGAKLGKSGLSNKTAALRTERAIPAPSPMVNRLRKQKSLHFAASSPARTRARGRGITGPARRLATSLADLSPLKPKPRRAKTLAVAALRQETGDEDAMDEDWVDAAPLSSSKQALQDPDGDQMSVVEDDSDSQSDVESEGQARLDTEDEFEASHGDLDGEDDEDEEDDGALTEREVHFEDDLEDSASDSDLTDVPDGSFEREPTPISPSKMRRLRNGKLRILPPTDVPDTDVEIESQLLTVTEAEAKSRRNGSDGKSRSLTKTIRPKMPTPPLSADNPEARSAEGDAVDELNGLDLESLQLTDKEIPARQLEKTSKIGSGGFKDVYVGIWKVGKRRNKVAIADIREKLTEMDIKELGLLRDLKHENIVRFIGVSIPEDTHRTGIPCMIISELCANGDLWDYVRNTKAPANLQVFRMLLQTARGLEYLHMHSIVHRDVKSSNVLVTRDRSCKINDFGLARVKTSQRSKMKSVVGTVNWQAVELWCKAPQYNEKVDVWSTAMTFWETLQWHEEYKSYPFEGMNDFEIYEDVGKDGKRPPTDSVAAIFGEDIVRLLNRMWDADPRKRPTMDMVCKDLERLIEKTELEMHQ